MNVSLASLPSRRISPDTSRNPVLIRMFRRGMALVRAASGPHPIERANLHSRPALLQKFLMTRIASAFISGAAKAQFTMAYTLVVTLLLTFCFA